MKTGQIGEIDLHAYVDGEMDAARAQDIRRHLANNPADAARVEAWRRQNNVIRRAFEPIAREATPPSLSMRPDPAAAPVKSDPPHLDAIRAARRRRRVVATIAAFSAGCAVALLAVVALGRLRPAPTEGAVAPTAVEAASLSAPARRARLAWRTYARAVDRALDQPQPDRGALAEALRRVAALPRVPDFTREDFDLVTARVMPGEAEPASFLLYESAAHVRVGLIVERTPDGDAPSQLADDGGLRCLFWRAGGFAYALVGPADGETLRGLGRAVVVAMAR